MTCFWKPRPKLRRLRQLDGGRSHTLTLELPHPISLLRGEPPHSQKIQGVSEVTTQVQFKITRLLFYQPSSNFDTKYFTFKEFL